MKKTAILSALLFCSLVAVPIQRKAEADSGEENAKKAVAPTITITNLDVTDKTLKLRYEIKNDSERDAWILVGADKYDVSAEVFMDEDDQTLLVRRRRDVPAYVYANFADCRYVRLRAGDTQTQSVSLTLPVCPHPAHARGRRARGLEYATRLALEIGYYPGDLPAMIRGLLAKAEKMSAPSADDYLATIKKYFLGSLTFNESNEGFKSQGRRSPGPLYRSEIQG